MDADGGIEVTPGEPCPLCGEIIDSRHEILMDSSGYWCPARPADQMRADFARSAMLGMRIARDLTDDERISAKIEELNRHIEQGGPVFTPFGSGRRGDG